MSKLFSCFDLISQFTCFEQISTLYQLDKVSAELYRNKLYRLQTNELIFEHKYSKILWYVSS